MAKKKKSKNNKAKTEKKNRKGGLARGFESFKDSDEDDSMSAVVGRITGKPQPEPENGREITEEQAPEQAVDVRDAPPPKGRSDTLSEIVSKLDGDAAYYVNFLLDEDWKVRKSAVEAIAIRKLQTPPELAGFLADDENSEVREAAGKLSE